MDRIFWLTINLSVGILFSGLGIYAWNRKKPMWFWSGSTVQERELTDVKAYNRANGIMWIVFSLLFWFCAFAGFFGMKAAGVILLVGCAAGLPALILTYRHIYKKYRSEK